jgi:ribose 5-phosphate isomerase B
MKIAIGSDHGGYTLKEEVKPFIEKLGHELKDVGCFSADSVDYPCQAQDVCKLVLSGNYERGILICGTGIGMSMAANRFQGIRAALCNGIFTAKMSRLHNDANVLCIGARVTGTGLALEIVRTWIETGFEGGRHKRRICMFDDNCENK